RVTAVERVFVDLKSQRGQAASSEQVHEVGRRLLEMRNWLDESRLQARMAEVEKKLQGSREDEQGPLRAWAPGGGARGRASGALGGRPRPGRRDGRQAPRGERSTRPGGRPVRGAE
ncbi:unnamed protein product, partial [Prorocentrum cordatum]